jgi:hypothetical protein
MCDYGFWLRRPPNTYFLQKTGDFELAMGRNMSMSLLKLLVPPHPSGLYIVDLQMLDGDLGTKSPLRAVERNIQSNSRSTRQALHH